MTFRSVLLGVCFIAAGLLPLAAEPESIGSLRTLAGPVFLARGGPERPLTQPERLYQGDVVRTGKGGSAGLLLKDDTSISLGPDSRLSLDQFAFAPTQGKLSLVARLLKGTMAFLSGRIAKLAPDAVKVETPVATVGIRGTYFLVQAEGE